MGQQISYSESDLTAVDWNAAIIYDPDYEDTAGVLELLNVELLEARYIDERLDQRITEYANLVHKRPEWPLTAAHAIAGRDPGNDRVAH